MKDWIPKVVRLDLTDMVPMQGYSCELKTPSEAQVLGLYKCYSTIWR